jgi:segregation and condensation protein B
MDLDKQIEALLFWKGEPVTLKRLSEFTKKTPEEVDVALNTLEIALKDRGIVLQRIGEEVTLGTAAAMGETIEALTKEEINRELSKATLETLSIILYKGPIRRSEIDFIRGVNSTFILRNLLIRGLIEKVTDPKDERVFLYKPTFELLSHLGVSKVEDLPEFGKVQEDLETWKRETAKTEGESQPVTPAVPPPPAPPETAV